LLIFIASILKTISISITYDNIVLNCSKMITLNKESNKMGKLFKYFFYLLILIIILLIGYSFFGDLSAPQEIITEKIQMPDNV
tara:strand:+ start:1541 stop:1789 length:249 start_codon:yes stop_codon:yes gene_type:complete